MRAFLLSPFVIALLCFGSSPAYAQTYFFIGSISVTPAEPTTTDAITISLTGDLSSSGAHIVSTSYMLMGNIVHITVHAADPGGLSVLVPHTEEVAIGTLPAGSYGILIDGDFILDSAPEFQHGFNVSGGPDCSPLTIESIQWSLFTDTAVVVHVTNSEVGFSYPAFVLLDAQGDTLAVETVNYFAIGAESWQTLTIHPGADIPVGMFDARLHLWTGFFSELACTWELPTDLCPAQECVMVHPYIQNTGGALALGTYTWSIVDDGGEVASGQFELTHEQQMDQADVCLSPGQYWMSASLDQEPTGGQLSFGVTGEWFISGPSTYLSPGTPALLPFDLLAPCIDGGNGISPTPFRARMIVASTADGIVIRTPNGEKLGTVRLFDGRGSLVETRTTTADHLVLRPHSEGMYVVQVDDEVHRVAFTTR